MHCEELPCFFDRPGRDENSTDVTFDQYNEVPSCCHAFACLSVIHKTAAAHMVCWLPGILSHCNVLDQQ